MHPFVFVVVVSLQQISVGLGAFNIVFGGVLFGSLLNSLCGHDFWIIFCITFVQVFGKWLRSCPEEVYYNFKRDEYEDLIVDCSKFFKAPGVVQSTLDALIWFDVFQLVMGSLQICLACWGTRMRTCDFGDRNSCRGIERHRCLSIQLSYSSVILKGTILVFKCCLYFNIERRGNLETVYRVQKYIKFGNFLHPFSIPVLGWIRKTFGRQVLTSPYSPALWISLILA